MKLILIGGLTTLLVGALVLGAMLVISRRGESVAPDHPGRDDQRSALPPPTRVDHIVRRLPDLAAPICIPLPGHACWRGRVLLSDSVRQFWRQERERVAAAAVDDAVEAEGEDQHRVEDSVEDETADGSEMPRPWRCGFAIHALKSAAPEPSPPLLWVTAMPRDGRPEDNPDAELTAEVDDDGTFLLQVPAGRYDLEGSSDDGLLAGGIDKLDAITGQARGDLEVTLLSALAITGQLVDDEGLTMEGTIEIIRLGQTTGHFEATNDLGAFKLQGLRAGTHRVIASVAGFSAPPVEIRAPVTNLQVRAPALTTGMVLLPQAADGSCPPASLALYAQPEGEGGPTRHLTFRRCRAIVDDISPGSSWRALGGMAGERFDRIITFDTGRTPAPVCLGGSCDRDAAAVNPRVLPPQGWGPSHVGVHLVDGPVHPARIPSHAVVTRFSPGFRAGAWYTFVPEKGTVAGPTTFWLVPGVNRISMRLR